MSKISEKFDELKKAGRVALIPYITGGFPSLAACERLITVLSEYSDLIEVGIPFSDPLADGPTIQKASQISLASGVTLADILQMIAGLRDKVEPPLVIMTYYNNIFKYGLKRFATEAAQAGVCGVIVPDLTLEESKLWREAAEGQLDTIFLLAPTSSDERIERIALASQGFVYCVSLTGVTGTRSSLPAELSEFITKVRTKTEKPLAVGFGISTPDQAARVAEVADGVIIGSALIDVIDKAESEEDQVESVRRFMAGIKRAMDESVKNKNLTSGS